MPGEFWLQFPGVIGEGQLDDPTPGWPLWRTTYLCTTSPLRMLSKWPWISHYGDYWQQAELRTDGACRIMMMMMFLLHVMSCDLAVLVIVWICISLETECHNTNIDLSLDLNTLIVEIMTSCKEKLCVELLVWWCAVQCISVRNLLTCLRLSSLSNVEHLSHMHLQTVIWTIIGHSKWTVLMTNEKRNGWKFPSLRQQQEWLLFTLKTRKPS